ncbi:TetR/AcrR family transcriptional regulator [Microbacterium sp.]|uniref:TetR/AcrR family transcriptional regulator n=1 Tax=Microbacterium sp. TaxID=51671 RepID=UPI002E369163|nr:TetR/AcrR family transcriptional regulator [Microbacterium sp.]HEX5730594.1 TetR/AcrR family transcriptional regulator [Microbacterium sp.]
MQTPVKKLNVSRAERARVTRNRMLTCAGALFLSQGYAATTVEQIAIDAGVAVQTVYYTFRTKGLLLRELVEMTAAGGEQAAPVMERAWARDMLSVTSAQRVLALAVEHGTAIYERVAMLWPAVAAAAAADSDVATYWSSVNAARRDGQRRMVARIVELDALRPDLDPEQATDLVVMFLGHAVYRNLVIEAGWPVATFRAWLFSTIVPQLLGPVEFDLHATEDLSFGGHQAGIERT